MTLRTVDYQIWPAGTPRPPAVVPTTPDRGTLTFDTEQVAREAILELLQSAPSHLGLLNTFEDLLVAGGANLLWRERGPGIGTEMRRGFSALFGRFFARAYLTEHHGLTRFMPLDRSPATVRSRVRVVVSGENRNLPDWIAVGQGRFVLAEAKGAYIGANGYRDRIPIPKRLEGARTQLREVMVEIERRPDRWTPIRTKGLGVLSRWGTHGGGEAPHLCVLDSSTEGEEATAEDIALIVAEVSARHTAMLLGALGYGQAARLLAPPLETSGGLPDEQRIAVTVGDDQRVFLGAVVGPTGRIRGEPDVLRSALAGLPDALARQFFFVGVAEDDLAAVLQGKFEERKSRMSIGSQGTVERDGTLVVPLREVVRVEPGSSILPNG